MRLSLLILAGAGIMTLGFMSINNLPGKQKKTFSASYQPVVVLELFTSQGCSSCPPADDLLPELAKSGSNIIPVSLHVDYWNRLGWTDPFSSPEYADRQRAYADFWKLESVYTPQLIINGEYEVVGSNKSQAELFIQKSINKKAEVKIEIEDVKVREGKIYFVCQSDGEWQKTELVAVILQKNAVTRIRAGENRGATLTNRNIVRALKRQDTGRKNEFQIDFPKKLSDDNWMLVVFAQQKNNFRITGAMSYDPSKL